MRKNGRTTIRARLHAFFNPKAMTSEELRQELRDLQTSASGQTVNETSAMRVAAVFASVRVITESVALLPLHVYRVDGERKVLDDTSRIYRLLHDQPNSWQTSFEFREQAVYHILMRGNAYAMISRDRAGEVRELVPMHPDRITVEQDRVRRLRYWYQTEDFGIVELSENEILHIRGLSLDGLVGVSVLTFARETIGGALALQDHGNRLFANGANPGIVLAHPGEMSDKAYDRLRESWDSNYAGTSRAGRTAIVEEGIKIDRIGMTSEDAQFLETRKLSRSEIAGLFRVPPHLVGDLEKASYNNIENMDIALAKHCVSPWTVRMSQALKRDVLTGNRFAEFDMDPLTQGDLKSRYEAYSLAIQNGIMSPNIAKGKEGLNPVENGDIHLVPLNMATLEQMARGPAELVPGGDENA